MHNIGLILNISLCTAHILDPRNNKNQVYSLDSLLLIIFSSVISGYDTPDTMVEFAKLKQDWLQQYVSLNSIPCAETLRHLMVCVKPSELIAGFQAFIGDTHSADHIAIDGKTMRGTRSRDQEAIHIISAWSNREGITLAALESEGKSNEIKTIPKLLDQLELKDATVTIDAMGCQKTIAQKIKDKKGHYVLQVKGNQKRLYTEIKAFFHKSEREHFDGIEHESFEEVTKGHGRIEKRVYHQMLLNGWIESASSWPGIQSVIRVDRTRIQGERESIESSWYVSSHRLNSELTAKAIRQHWGIENKLHWRLDVLFKDDHYRSNSSATNMAVIKRFCMNLLKKHDPSKRTMKVKMMASAIDDSYRAKILLHG